MVAHFIELSNTAIDLLVQRCTPAVSFITTPGVLFTPTVTQLGSDQDHSDEPVESPDAPPPPISTAIAAYPFSTAHHPMADMVIAVDSGVVTLGYLVGGGVAFAIRGAAVCLAADSITIFRYNTGALVVSRDNMLSVFEYIGERLGAPELYVQRDANGQLLPKQGVLENPNQLTDRCRNFIERMIQEEALGILSANGGGMLLIDGALTVSYDTPTTYLTSMLRYARNNDIDVCAISKRSRISIGGIPIDALFDAYPTFVGYAKLFDALEQERQAYEARQVRTVSEITHGSQLFAARFGFGPPGLTFRVDVSQSYGSTDDDVINNVYNRCRIYGGYPRPLIDAHQHSAFLSGDAMTLLADLVVRANVQLKEQPSMAVLFQPFGAFGK